MMQLQCVRVLRCFPVAFRSCPTASTPSCARTSSVLRRSATTAVSATTGASACAASARRRPVAAVAPSVRKPYSRGAAPTSRAGRSAHKQLLTHPSIPIRCVQEAVSFATRRQARSGVCSRGMLWGRGARIALRSLGVRDTLQFASIHFIAYARRCCVHFVASPGLSVVFYVLTRTNLCALSPVAHSKS